MALNWFKSKPAADAAPAASAPGPAATPAEAELLAQSLVKQLSSEILQALAPAQAQVQQLRQLSPTLTQRMQPVFDAIERTHDIAKSAQLFNDTPNLGPVPETLDAANIVRAAILGRSDWLQARQVQVRQALNQAQVQARPGELYTFIDELLLWASDFSHDVALQLDSATIDDKPRARLRVSARVTHPQDAHNPKWQNTRWFVWHRIAKRLGARTELRTEDDHVLLRISFPALGALGAPAPKPAAGQPPSPALHPQLKGVRVLMISSHADRRAAVMDALVPQGVLCDVALSVASARQQLDGQTLDAVIFDDSVSPEDRQTIRQAPSVSLSTAFVEIHEPGAPRDFQNSTVGAVSTGHVAANAIARALVPTLNFELFKDMG